jgi:hypothetical protein
MLPALMKPEQFMHDDSYFYLQVAHNIAQGNGSTFHGITPTNGYHPLWLWMVTFTSMVAGGEKMTSLYLAFALQALLLVGGAIAIKRLSTAMGLGEGLIPVAVLVAYLTGTAVSGSEAHVNAACLLVGLGCLWRALDARGTPIWLVTGVVLGAAMLARLDNVFVVLALSICALAYVAADDWRRAGMATIWLGIGGAVVVLPYVASNFLSYGHLVPISGAIKSTFPTAMPNLDNLGPMGKLAAPFGLVSLGIGLFLDADRRRRVVWLGLGTGVLLHAGYIVCYTDHYTFWAWYYVAGVISAALCAGYLFSLATGLAPRRLPASRVQTLALTIAIVILAGGSARAWLKGFGLEGIGPLEVQVRIGQYRWPGEFGRWLKAHFPEGTRIFAYDWPGAIAFYSDLSLLPMDGLVNDYQYNDDLLAMGIHDYLCENDIHYFFGLIEPWQQDVEVVVTAPLYGTTVGTLDLRQEDIVVRTDDVLTRPEEALPFAVWRLHCPADGPAQTHRTGD